LEKLRVGVIGTGFGAKVHVPLFEEHPKFKVVAISSVSRGRTKEIAKETGITNIYTDWRQMLDVESLDVVSIVSAPFLHHDMVLAALEKGCHVLCEKPMAFNQTEAVRMLEARNAAQKLGAINFEWRFLPARLAVKDILDSGRLGDVTSIRYDWTIAGYTGLKSRSFGWLMDEQAGGGMLGAIGSHMFDSLCWWLGDNITELTGQLSTHVPEYHSETGEVERRTADNAFNAVGRFRSGADFTASFLYGSRHSTGSKVEIYGTEGTLVMTDDNKLRIGYGSEPLHEVDLEPGTRAPESATDIVKRYYPAFRPMVDRLYDSIALGQADPNLPLFEDGVKVQAILDAIRISSKEGRRVKLLFPL
jgi:predicted dehydrogenase